MKAVLSVQPFRKLVATVRVLWLLLTPANSARLLSRGYEDTSRVPQVSPDKNVIFLPATTRVYRNQILPRGRHPCSWLTVGVRQTPGL